LKRGSWRGGNLRELQATVDRGGDEKTEERRKAEGKKSNSCLLRTVDKGMKKANSLRTEGTRAETRQLVELKSPEAKEDYFKLVEKRKFILLGTVSARCELSNSGERR